MRTQSGASGATPGQGDGRGERTDRKRALLSGSTLGVGVALVAALLVMVNYLGAKYHVRGDWTETKLYSLSEKTENVLAGLDDFGQDVEATIFISPIEQTYEPTREVLTRYAARSDRFSVRTVDREKNPMEADALIRQFQVQTEGVVFSAGDDRRFVDATDLVDIDFAAVQQGAPPSVAGYKGEQVFTSALVDLTSGEKPRVVFTTGHGERSLDDRSGAGLSRARQSLGDDNFEIEEWASLGQTGVPQGTDLLVVAGPTSTFVPPELAIFDSYLNAGGRMLVLLDPVLAPTGELTLLDSGLSAWLDGYGVRVGDDLVIDPESQLPFFGAETVFVNRYGAHPITASLSEGSIPLLFSAARSVAATTGESYSVEELFRTGPQGWGETDFANLEDLARGDDDTLGPVPLGVVVSPGSDDGSGGPAEGPASGEASADDDGFRLVVLGDSDVLADSLIESNAGNVLLVNDLFNWMTERESLLGIPPKRPEQVLLTLDSGQFWRTLLVVFLLPVAAVGFGIGVWFRRRKR